MVEGIFRASNNSKEFLAKFGSGASGTPFGLEMAVGLMAETAPQRVERRSDFARFAGFVETASARGPFSRELVRRAN